MEESIGKLKISVRQTSVTFCEQNHIVLLPTFKDEIDDNEEVLQDPEGSSEEDKKREVSKLLFDRLDTNQTGSLEIKELARMIKENHDACRDLPKTLTKAILKKYKTDSEGRLEFEEFFRLSQKQSSLIIHWFVSYCRLIVPLRNGRIICDDPSPCGTSVATQYDSEDGAYESQMTFNPPPLTMVIFSIIEIIFFIVDYNMRNLEDEQDFGPMGRTFMVLENDCMQIWRYMTYMFIHHAFDHLLFNLIIQLFLGTALELVHCWWRVVLVYLSGAIAGSLGSYLSQRHRPLRGASGGVYALMTAHIATVILNSHDMKHGTNQLFVFLVFISSDISFSFHHFLANPNGNIGHVCHLSGAIAGLLVGIGVLRNLNERPIEKKLWWISVTTYFGLIIAAISIHVRDHHA